ncbi:MAG: hypothetical protein WD624_01540 [Rhodospirillales bacterium]
MNSSTEDGSGKDYLEEIADLTKLVESGHDLVNQGNQIDLSNLEQPIADLCRRMALVPPGNAEEVSSAIQHLVSRLGALSTALQTQAKARH